MTRAFLLVLNNWAEVVGRTPGEGTEFNSGVDVVDTESPGGQ